MTDRRYFETQRAAEDWLYDHCFAPIDAQWCGPHSFNWCDGDALAEIRYNAAGYFIVQVSL